MGNASVPSPSFRTFEDWEAGRECSVASSASRQEEWSTERKDSGPILREAEAMPVIVGQTREFAVESHISAAYEELGLRALGFFTLLIKGRRFGVHEHDATMLANSFDEVCRRIAHRGQHIAPFGADSRPYEIASAIVSVLYCDIPSEAKQLGMTNKELAVLTHERRLVWAPDGDAAFDDRSHVVQFDVDNQVRLIAFRRGEEGLFDEASLVDQWLPAEEFYTVLEEWRDCFTREWIEALRDVERR